MRTVFARKTSLHEPHDNRDLQGKSPAELIAMVWQLTLDAWSFKEKLDAQPRLQRHVVVLKRRKG
jgi:hypothetical protein